MTDKELADAIRERFKSGVLNNELLGSQVVVLLDENPPWEPQNGDWVKYKATLLNKDERWVHGRYVGHSPFVVGWGVVAAWIDMHALYGEDSDETQTFPLKLLYPCDSPVPAAEEGAS